MKQTYQTPHVKVVAINETVIMAASGTNGWQDKRGIVVNGESQTDGDAGTAHAKSNFLWEDEEEY